MDCCSPAYPANLGNVAVEKTWDIVEGNASKFRTLDMTCSDVKELCEDTLPRKLKAESMN